MPKKKEAVAFTSIDFTIGKITRKLNVNTKDWFKIPDILCEFLQEKGIDCNVGTITPDEK